MLAGVFRLTTAVIVLLAGLSVIAELVLRAYGATPRAPVELSRAVPDGWTGFRLRPNVSGDEPLITNDLGLHAPHTYPLEPRTGSVRVAVLGSSVVYGMGMDLADTIPAVVERELRASGIPAEALNFGTHAFTIVHLSAQLQAYVHQFRPDVVVAVIDLQVGVPHWPDVRAASNESASGESRWQTLVRRGVETSALLALVDDPRRVRRWIRRVTGLPLRPRTAPASGPEAAPPSPPSGNPVPPAAVATPAAPPRGTVRSYEDRRERELAAPLAAMAAFCREQSISLIFVTPYGPYFDATEDELAAMSVQGFIGEAISLHGSERVALEAEVELISRVIRRVADGAGVGVVDMLEASRRSSLRNSSDFTPDAVHLTQAGNVTLGRLIAARIARDMASKARREPASMD
jgi:hypothetical protein